MLAIELLWVCVGVSVGVMGVGLRQCAVLAVLRGNDVVLWSSIGKAVVVSRIWVVYIGRVLCILLLEVAWGVMLVEVLTPAATTPRWRSWS